ncbi:uncharacterized protein LOC122498976 [Leptopilina heterotoma]|uniref:uncharacterized protein LOC122498976 n=1 Tax=Leptopilina heterotoma TaxID=63436 RepID=UPI001CA8EDE5|nr:uncharacterized protein LOC122498976 [Leptopilina heterotoma]
MILKYSLFLTLELILFVHFYTPVFTKKQNKLRFCIVNSFHTRKSIENVCQNLVQSKNNKVECVVETDRTQCLRMLINDQADFMSAEPEDLIVLALNKENNNKILVTHELRVWENEYSSFKTVVVVRKDIENLWHTENRHLCLPGFEKNSVLLDYIKFLETKFVSSDCSLEKSLLENRLSALSQYFESACISGPWTNDEQLDMQMKKKYGNLCSRCKNSQECSKDDKFYGKEGVLLCLTEGGGDIAWARLKFVRYHFKRFGGEEDYRFLCPDGSIRNLSDDPCVWFEEPWRTTIARKAVAERVSKFISDQNNQVGDFLTLLQYDLHRTPISTEALKTPEDYFKLSFPDYYSLKDYLQCKPDRRMKWCVVTNLEVEKCNWLSYAANSYGIEPLIECVQELSRKNCLESVKNKMSDIFVVNSSEEFEAKIKGLRPIIHMVTKKKNQTVALVKKYSDLQSFTDLKNLKACFSGYRDIGWNTFIYLMKNLTGDNNWYCKDKEMVSQFFKESCVFQLNAQDFSTFPKNLYSLCSHLNFGNRNITIKNCLDSDVADVSFLNFNSATPLSSKYSEVYYRTLCSNEFVDSSNKERECILSWLILGSIMVNKNVSSSREEDIFLLFMDLNGLFGETYQGTTPLMSLHGPFEKKENIIFSEFSEFTRDLNKKDRTLHYNEIIEDLKKYQLCSEADFLRNFIYTSIFLPIIIIILINMVFKEWIILLTVCSFAFNLQSTVFAEKQKIRYCVVDDTIPHEIKNLETCPLLVDIDNSPVTCIIAVDRVSCLRHLLSGEVDFLIAEPEDLMIYAFAEDYNNKILVTHIIPQMSIDLPSHQMVVIVRNNIEDIFHTEKKRFCSPGFEPGVMVRDYVKYFESRITPRKCDPEKSLLENRMASLSEYFESACISGPWTIDYQRNKKLKKTYPNLCAECGDPTKCSHEDSFFGKWGALKCLLSMKGDVTWATLHAVHQDLQLTNKDEYSFLCPNEKTKNLTDKACVWLEEPQRTIAVSMTSAEKVGRFMKNPQNSNILWRLFVGVPKPVELPATPLDYLQRSFPEYYSLKDYAKCTPDRTIKWCVTTNLEAEKCKWISFAAQSHGLEPLIKCVQETSRENCMESVKNGISDIFAIEKSEEVEAKRRGLEAIAYMMMNSGLEDITVALVHKFSNFTSLRALENHKACFPGYREFEWNTFLYAMKKLTGYSEWYSNDKEMVSKYFNESCVANLHNGNGSEKDFPKNLYSLCSLSTQTNEKNILRQPRNPTMIVEKFEMPKKEEIVNSDQAMFNCLIHNKADVAFVNLSSFVNIYPELIGTVFRVICLNESKTIDHCFSAKKSLGSLVVNKSITGARKDDIYFMLLDIDRIFGITYQIVSKLITLYGPFNGTNGVIFPEGTQFLDPIACDSPCKLSYNEVSKDISLHFQNNTANVLQVNIAILLILFLII